MNNNCLFNKQNEKKTDRSSNGFLKAYLKLSVYLFNIPINFINS